MIKTTIHQKLPTKYRDREVLRNKGQFWTPSWVADAMVTYVKADSDLVFDPAAGRGAFCKSLQKIDSSIKYYGIDVDSDLLGDEVYRNEKCFVELRDFIKDPPGKKFKSIVANPPYIRHHRIDESTKRFLKKLFVSITGFLIDGRAGLHIYFLVQALNLLQTGGGLAFIMPADTCEGKFAKSLWKWISEKFCIDAVITFAEEATPFPGVDTNAMIFLIRNSKPKDKIFWVKAKEPSSDDLTKFVLSEFSRRNFPTLEIVERELGEALKTGFSRPKQVENSYRFHLNDFAKVMRGIATGANNFFFLTEQQIKELEISQKFFVRAIGRTKDVQSDIINKKDIQQLNERGRPTYLLALDRHEVLPSNVLSYLKKGEELGIPKRSLIKQRKPWYKMEKREVPPILFAYLGRRNTRFILNNARVLPLTGFLCVYPIYSDEEFVVNLCQALNHKDTLEKLKLVGKSYGSGAIKVEPKSLNLLPIPEHIVSMYHLKRPYVSKSGQLEMFGEPKQRYIKRIVKK